MPTTINHTKASCIQRTFPAWSGAVLATFLSMSVPARATTDSVETAEEVEVVEVQVQEVSPADVQQSGPASSPRPGQAPRSISLLETIGRLHPAAVHFPIAWLLLLALVEWLLWARPRYPAQIGLALHGLTCLSFFPAAASGIIRSSAFPSSGLLHATIERHEGLAIFTAVVCLLFFVLRLMRPQLTAGKLKLVTPVLVTLLALVIGAVGHLGGKISFGADFLPF